MSKLPENQYYIQFNYQKFLIDGTVDLVDDASQAIWLKLFFASLNYEDMGQFKVNGKPITTNDIAKKLGRSKRKIERALGQLFKVGLCEQLSDGTIIIPNTYIDHFANNLHAKYNQNEVKVNAKCFQNEKENGSLQPKTNTPYIREENIREEKKEKSIKKESQDLIDGQRDVSPNGSTQKGSRLPDDWSPNENDIAYAKTLGLDVIRTTESFCDYWHAKAGAGARKVDWSLTWKTWCRKENDWANVHRFPKQSLQQPIKKQHNLDWQVEEDNQLWGNA